MEGELRKRRLLQARKTAVLRLLDSYIPMGLSEYHHLENLLRARVMLSVPFAVGISHIATCVLIYRNLSALGDLRWMFGVAILASGLMLLSTALFRRTGSFQLCANIYGLGAVLAIFSLIVVTGGAAHSPFVIFLPLVVVFTFIMDDIRTALLWAGVALLLWWINVATDRVYPNLITPDWRAAVELGAVLNAGVCMMAVLWFFDLSHRRLLRRVQVERDRALFSAAHDPLTGLANRKTFHQRLDYLLAHQQGADRLHALLMIDLNDFKTLNDTRGHASGDAMLKHVATQLVACVRRSDIVSRLGGDEFGILLSDVRSVEALVPILEKIQRAVSEPITLSEGGEAEVGASIGVALLPVDGDHPEQLLHRADLAMYHAKGSARGYSFVENLIYEMERKG